MKSISIYLFFLLLLTTSCQAQKTDVSQRDAPASVDEPASIDSIYQAIPMYTEDQLQVLKNASKVEAYHLDKFENDTTKKNLYGFKVLKHVKRISANQADTLKALLAKTEDYVPSMKRCGLPADLAFKLKDGKKTMIVFVALECDVIYATLESGEQLNFIMDIPMGIKDYPETTHNSYLSLAKEIFPTEYESTEPLQITISDTTNNTIDTATVDTNQTIEGNTDEAEESDTDTSESDNSPQ